MFIGLVTQQQNIPSGDVYGSSLKSAHQQNTTTRARKCTRLQAATDRQETDVSEVVSLKLGARWLSSAPCYLHIAGHSCFIPSHCSAPLHVRVTVVAIKFTLCIYLQAQTDHQHTHTLKSYTDEFFFDEANLPSAVLMSRESEWKWTQIFQAASILQLPHKINSNNIFLKPVHVLLLEEYFYIWLIFTPVHTHTHTWKGWK